MRVSDANVFFLSIGKLPLGPLGHTKMDNTVRYLGVELEAALVIAEALEI